MSFTTTTYQREFPGLSRLGLYASKIDGDGNCLFRSLSDQKFGYPTEHEVMRGNTIDYMRDHPEEFKGFIPVNPGGGTRRNPKRKNTQPTTVFTPTQEEIDRVWEQHLAYMAEGGTWGDNIELVAFARAYNVNIRIYVHDFAYNIFAGPEDPDREVLHIAWHKWEHYSSIRNIDGPHTGLPEVRVRAADPETEEKQEEMLANAPYALPWQIDVVSKSLPYLVDKTTIKKTLEEAKGNIDAAVSKLMD
ncbi:cysteine proteinase, partial [Saccharata proteae CBS 121410]